uniref:Uncharacterized protein n=1 Tax=Meloidogyne hapla TaxID=6305 RepID=A0A1I8BJU8_MELHA
MSTHQKSLENGDKNFNDNNNSISLKEGSSSSSVSSNDDDDKPLNKTNKTNVIGKNSKKVESENEDKPAEDKSDFQPISPKRPKEMDNNLNASSPLLDRNQSQKSLKKYLNPTQTSTIIPTNSNYSSIDSLRSDWRSLYICTFLTFCSAVQFSLYFSSMRQYLQIVGTFYNFI